MTETAGRVLSLFATVQETPPDHKGGYSLGRDQIVNEDTEYEQVLKPARRRVPKARESSP